MLEYKSALEKIRRAQDFAAARHFYSSNSKNIGHLSERSFCLKNGWISSALRYFQLRRISVTLIAFLCQYESFIVSY
jgi:hypothetical protein